MADILLTARFNGRSYIAKISGPLDWIPYDAGDAAKREVCPDHLTRVQIGTDKQQFLQYIPSAEDITEEAEALLSDQDPTP